MESKFYTITADYKKSSYQTEQWNNILSNGKRVTYEITNYFYWGTFEIELTDKEKEEPCRHYSADLFAGIKSVVHWWIDWQVSFWRAARAFAKPHGLDVTKPE